MKILQQVRIVGYRRFRDIPADRFQYLCDQVTLWRMGGLMRSRAESYRNRDKLGPIVVALHGDTPVGWMFVDHADSIEMCVVRSWQGKGVATELLVALSVLTGDHDKPVYSETARRIQNYAKAELMRRFLHLPWRTEVSTPHSRW